MAYVSQERKALLLPGIKAAIPASWKWSLSVDHHSTLVLTIRQSPEDILGAMRASGVTLRDTDMSAKVNPYYVEDQFKANHELRTIMTTIKAAMMAGNHDNSDPMTDYFDVGWYIEINIGRWNDPYLQVLEKSAYKSPYKKVTYNPHGKAKPSRSKLLPFLPDNFKHLSPGKKAAATKAAMKSYYGSVVL